jgi:hypothetical protein
MHIWRNSLVSMPKPGISLRGGWNGFQDRKLGCHSYNFRSEWVKVKKQRKFCISIYSVFLR